jgi:YspA, cpYpsA-related SLOG family
VKTEIKKCVIVTGGRDYGKRLRVYEALDGIKPDLVIEGGATGADQLARDWADERGVHRATVPALWKKFDRAAGPMRNGVMVEILKALSGSGRECVVCAFPGGRGTASCVSIATDAGLYVKEVSND